MTSFTFHIIKFRRVLLFSFIGFSLQFCCSIVIPQISLTGNKTAIEKQILGDSTELEKDVWMISSAKSVAIKKAKDAGTKENIQKIKENRLTFEGFAIIDAFSSKLESLKKDKVVGESNKGLLTNLLAVKEITIKPVMLKKYNEKLKDDVRLGRKYRTLIETIKQINRARNLLIEGYIQRKKQTNKKFKANINALRSVQRKKYHAEALKGEYLQMNNNTWSQK